MAAGTKPPRRGRPLKAKGKLARWMEERGKTQTEVAKILGVSQSRIGSVANEERRPSLELAVKISKMTDGEVSVEYLSSIPRHTR